MDMAKRFPIEIDFNERKSLLILIFSPSRREFRRISLISQGYRSLFHGISMVMAKRYPREIDFNKRKSLLLLCFFAFQKRIQADIAQIYRISFLISWDIDGFGQAISHRNRF
jgi:hypothetical protein